MTGNTDKQSTIRWMWSPRPETFQFASPGRRLAFVLLTTILVIGAAAWLRFGEGHPLWLAILLALAALPGAYLAINNSVWLESLHTAVAIAHDSVARSGPRAWWLAPLLLPGLGTIATIVLIFGWAVSHSELTDWWVRPGVVLLMALVAWLSVTLPITTTYLIRNHRPPLADVNTRWGSVAPFVIVLRGWWTAFVVLGYGAFLSRDATVTSIEREVGSAYEIVMGLAFLCYWLFICLFLGLFAQSLRPTLPARVALIAIALVMTTVLLSLPSGVGPDHFRYSTTISVLQGLAGLLLFIPPFIAVDRWIGDKRQDRRQP